MRGVIVQRQLVTEVTSPKEYHLGELTDWSL
jgi:hypothetical protein